MIAIYSLEEACAAAWRGAFRGLRSQGWEHSMIRGLCAMRGTHGRACAVGWLFESGKRPLQQMNSYCNAESLIQAGFRMALPLQVWVANAPTFERHMFFDFCTQLRRKHDSTKGSAIKLRDAMVQLGASRGWAEPS